VLRPNGGLLRDSPAAPSDASGNGEMDGDAEKSGVTEGLAKVSEVAGTEAAGAGLAKRPGADGLQMGPGNVPPGARSGSVTRGGRRGTRKAPGDKAVAGFADLSLIVGRIGACGTPGADALPGPLSSPSSAFLRPLNSARRRSSSFSSASCSVANCRFTSRSISACISASVSCFWQEQNIVKEIITSRPKSCFMSGLDPIQLPYSNKQTTCRRPQGINASAPTEKLPASRLQFRPAPGGNAGYWHTRLRVPLIRGS
jgi:hypothetical protein